MQNEKKRSGYRERYASGKGWKYDYASERRDLQRMVDAIGLQPGAAVLEIGCGEGFHASILYDMGFRVTGNEYTDEGVASARKNHPLVNYIQGDSMKLLDKLPPEHFDMILARGHSWWHYELDGSDTRNIDAPAKTRAMFKLLKPGGHFILRIRTDFSGGKAEDGVVMNTRKAYVDLFAPLGEVVYVTDKNGTPLPDEAAARRSGKNIVIATRKPGGEPRKRSRRQPAGPRVTGGPLRKRVARTLRRLGIKR